MKRNKLLISSLIICSSVMLAGCNNSKVPEVKKGEDTIVKNLTSTPDKYDAETSIFASLGKLDDYKTYKKESNGKTTTNKDGNNYIQETSCSFIKNDNEYYTDSTSKSNYIDIEHESFYKNNKVAYRDKSNQEILNTTYDNYQEIYGVTPIKLLSGQIFNQETIINAKLISKNNNEYTYFITLDKTLSNALLVYQMKKFGNLDAYPVFTNDTEFTLTMKNDFTPISYSYIAKYNISNATLGDLECVEELNASFSKFNEQVTIPDTELFNKAINETPTIIDPGEIDDSDDENQPLIDALLDLDLQNGIALTGNANINNFILPIKLNLKIDLKKLLQEGTNDIANNIDATFYVISSLGNINVIYHENKLYVNLLDNKVVFSLPEANEDNSTSIKEILSYFNLNKISEDKYNLSLSDKGIDLIYNKLNEIGLINEEDKSTLSMNATITLLNNKINRIELKSTIKNINISFDTYVIEEKYVLPSLDGYISKINIFKEFTLNSDNNTLANAISGNFYFTYNTEITNIKEAFKLEINLTISDSIKTLLNLASSLSSDIPEWLNPISKADSINLLLENGHLYLIALNGDSANFVKEIELNNSLPNINNLNIKELIQLLLKIFKINFVDDYISLSLSDEIINQVRSYWIQLPKLIIDKLGATIGALLPSMLDLYKPLENIYVKINLKNNDFTFDLKLFDITSTNVYNSKLKYETFSLINLTVSNLTNDTYEYSWDLNNYLPYEEQAKLIREEIINLKNNYSLKEEYLNELKNFKTKYDNLDTKVKSLVYNGEIKTIFSTKPIVDSLISDYNTQKKNVDNFANNAKISIYSLSLLNKTFNKFNEAQMNYLNETYNKEKEIYLARRIENEKTNANEIKTLIDNLPSLNLENATYDELFNQLIQFDTINKQINKCYIGSLTNIDYDNYQTLFNNTLNKYVEIGSITMNSYLDQLQQFNTSYDLSVKEMNKLYQNIETFYNNYNNNFMSNSSTIKPILEEKYSTFTNNMFVINYYLISNPHFYRLAAVKIAEKEIDDIINKTYTKEQLKTKINDLDILISHTDKDSISNYNAYKYICSLLEK